MLVSSHILLYHTCSFLFYNLFFFSYLVFSHLISSVLYLFNILILVSYFSSHEGTSHLVSFLTSFIISHTRLSSPVVSSHILLFAFSLIYFFLFFPPSLFLSNLYSSCLISFIASCCFILSHHITFCLISSALYAFIYSTHIC